MLRDVLAIAIGRLTRRALLLVRPGGGTAIPGRVVERLSPDLLVRILRQPRLVVVTGSNGKGTTTKMLAAILRAAGADLWTNRMAGNITRGLLSELITVVDARGRFPHELAVLEVDEAYSAVLLERTGVDTTVLLNVMLDQLHRWGSPDRAAEYLARTARATGGALVLNRDDGHLRAIGTDPAGGLRAEVRWFGLAPALLAALPHGNGSAPYFGPDHGGPAVGASTTEVLAVDGRSAVLGLSGDGELEVGLPSPGVHLAADSAAAVEAARAVLRERFDPEVADAALTAETSMFARGEVAEIRGVPTRLLLMKSPPTAQANLDVLPGSPEQLMVIAGKDLPDPSLLWPVDWSAVDRVRVVTGQQAQEMALRLVYSGIRVDEVIEDVGRAAERFTALPPPTDGLRTVVFTAEGMRTFRRLLGLHGASTKAAPEDAA